MCLAKSLKTGKLPKFSFNKRGLQTDFKIDFTNNLSIEKNVSEIRNGDQKL